MNLSKKMYTIGLIPFLFFLGSMFLYPIKQNFSDYRDSLSLDNKIQVMKLSSKVVNETQKERGMTAGYLNGGVKFEKLLGQRKNNDKAIKEFKEALSTSTFSKKYQNELIQGVSGVKEIRNKVNSKSISLPKALKSYTLIVTQLLDLEPYIAKSTKLSKVAAELSSFRIIEDTKEAGGKLRANMSAVFTADKPVTNAKLQTIIDLKAGVINGLTSSGLSLEDETRNYISKFQASPEWKEVNYDFKVLLGKYKEGNYGLDADVFFKKITMSLNILQDLIQYKTSYIDQQIVEIKKKAVRNLWISTLTVTATILFVFFFITTTVKKTNLRLKDVIANLNASTSELVQSSSSISDSSVQLSESSTEQAASLQETVSTINEISSMVQRNANSARVSSEVSEEAKNEALAGQKNISDMTQSMREIDSSNKELAREIERNNSELTKITNMISEINEKTQVINDIVFQTKLLSFNASVEAARAGEHGKGFAVVAEEVGNLASMSGKASLDISEMLETSTQQVFEIIENSKKNFQSLLESNNHKVEQGLEVTEKCGSSLNSILESSSKLNEMVSEISSASTEQAAGINEMTKALHDLDSATNLNASEAQKSAVMSTQLKGSSKRLSDAVEVLSRMVYTQDQKEEKTKSSKEKSHPNHENQDGNIITFDKSA